MTIKKVERHKKGWAVVKREIGGHLDGMKTVLSVHRTKAEAMDALQYGCL